MNTGVVVVGSPVDPRPWFAEYEAHWSRFDAESGLSQLNRAAGRWVLVPDLLRLAVNRALVAAKRTGGAFDPTILQGLVAAGYGQSFEQGPTGLNPAVSAGRWSEVELGPGMIRLPAGVGLDLGGIGKGLAVDLTMERIRRAYRGEIPEAVEHLLVDAGGDLLLWTRPGASPWLLEVEDPWVPERTLGTLYLHQGAVATSSVLGRSWGEGLHHIIDPWTGRPSQSDLVSATILGPSAAQADALAKAVIVLGQAQGERLIQAAGCEGLLVTRQGDLILSPGLEGFFHGNAE